MRTLRNIARFRLHAHILRVETSLWQEHTSACDRGDQGGLQNEKHAVFLCSCASVTSRKAPEHQPVHAVAPATQEHQSHRALASAQPPREMVLVVVPSFVMEPGQWE
eukprot:804291-Pelagomonas_calceolata.AAC.1